MFSLLPDFMKVISLNDASSSLQLTKEGNIEINFSQKKYVAHTTVRNVEIEIEYEWEFFCIFFFSINALMSKRKQAYWEKPLPKGVTKTAKDAQ